MLVKVFKRSQQVPGMWDIVWQCSEFWNKLTLAAACLPFWQHERESNILANPVQTHGTLLAYASTITRQKKSWVLLDPKFEAFQTSPNDSQQLPTTPTRVLKRTQHVWLNDLWCWLPTMSRGFCTGLKNSVVKKVHSFIHSSIQEWEDISTILFSGLEKFSEAW